MQGVSESAEIPRHTLLLNCVSNRTVIKTYGLSLAKTAFKFPLNGNHRSGRENKRHTRCCCRVCVCVCVFVYLKKTSGKEKEKDSL